MRPHLVKAGVLAVVVMSYATAQTRIDLRTQSRDVDFSGASSTKPSKTGTTPPATCSLGETFFKTDAQPGQNLFACTATNVWTLQGGSAIGSVFGRTGAITPQAGDYAASQVTNAVDRTAGNTYSAGATQTFVPSASASGLRLTPSALPAIPQPGDVVVDAGDSNHAKVFDGTAWVSMTTVPNYSLAFTSATTVVVPGTSHKLGTANLVVEVYDNRTPAWRVEPDYILIDPVTYDVTVDFETAQSGRVVISAAGGGAGGLGAVTSVFGRAGAVTAQSGDYAFGQISGTIIGAQLPAAGGDLAGSLTGATVTALRNRPIASTVPNTGQALVWNGTSGQWEPQTVTGGSGAGMAAQLGDFLVTRTSATTLTVGANCSTPTPCNVRVGAVVYSVTGSATVTLTSGTGVAYIYSDYAGNLTVGHNLTLSCSAGCTAVSGITAFPVNSIPLFTWAATSNTWDPTGVDRRAFLSAKTLGAGAGIVTVEAGSQTQVAVDSATVPTYLTATATLDFPSIAAESCSDLTLAVPGAATGDGIAAGWPAGLEAGLLGTMRVSAANTVAVRLCNFSGATLNPAGGTFRATVVRNF